MAARFIGDAEIGAGATPFRTVRRDAAAASALLREQVSQLVAQGAINFRLAEIAQPAIQQDAEVSVFRAAGGGTETG